MYQVFAKIRDGLWHSCCCVVPTRELADEWMRYEMDRRAGVLPSEYVVVQLTPTNRKLYACKSPDDVGTVVQVHRP